MGYSDLGCYGGEVKTPNIDKLAKGGLRFHPVLQHSQVSHHPGRTSHRQLRVLDRGSQHGTRSHLLREVLRPIGYRTLIAGKGTRCLSRPPVALIATTDWPMDAATFSIPLKARRGPSGRKGKTRVRRWAIEDKVIMGYTSPDKKFYHTDAFTDYAIDRLDEYKNENKPFVLYLPYTAPHYPLHAWPEDIAKYRGKYKIGWDKIQEQRFKRMNEMGIIGPNHELTPRASKAWEDLSKNNRIPKT